jgi:hypothetical protein
MSGRSGWCRAITCRGVDVGSVEAEEVVGKGGAGLGWGNITETICAQGTCPVGFAGACSEKEVGAISIALFCPEFAIECRIQLGRHSGEVLDGLEIVYICSSIRIVYQVGPYMRQFSVQ